MRFAALPYVYLLWLLPVLLALYVYAFRRKRHALALFLDQALAPRLLIGVSQTRQWLKALVLVGAVGGFVIALTQPQWGKRWQDVPRRGRDLMILLDVSRSMLAEDVTPNRLERAKLDIKDLVTVLQQEGGHRLGLIAFAGRASLQCPLTHDYAFFLQQLNALGPETVGRGGTLIGDAIRQALRAFTTLEHNFKDIILITDGGDHESFPLEAAKAAAVQQVAMYTIGLGNPAAGAPIPLRTPQGQGAYVRYEGKEVHSRMRENLLIDIAHLTGGAYVPAGTHAIELDRIYTEHIAQKARRDLDVATRERFVHRFQWFLAAGVLLLAIDMLLPAGTNRQED